MCVFDDQLLMYCTKLNNYSLEWSWMGIKQLFIIHYFQPGQFTKESCKRVMKWLSLDTKIYINFVNAERAIKMGE